MRTTRRRRTLLILTLLAAIASGAARQASAAATATADKPKGRSNPVGPIVDGMQQAQARLKRGDTGTETRAIQERAVNDLQKLIDAAKSKSSGQNSGSRENSSQENSSQQNRSPSQSGSNDSQSSRAGHAIEPGKKSGAGHSAASEKRPAASTPQLLLRDVWGHLPPAVRERIPADFGETILPAYDDLVRRYFEALLDDSSSKRSMQESEPRAPTP